MGVLPVSNLPPPQLSSDGRWRWDGEQWVPVKPPSSKQPELGGPGAPQLSTDGRWWWNGYEWAPAEPASSKRTKPPGAGALANIAAGCGLIVLVSPIGIGLAEAPPGQAYDTGFALGVLALPLSCGVLGLALGVLALVFPGQGHDHSLRRRLAWVGIGAALAFVPFMAWVLSSVS
jgi:hypothetical protein